MTGDTRVQETLSHTKRSDSGAMVPRSYGCTHGPHSAREAAAERVSSMMRSPFEMRNWRYSWLPLIGAWNCRLASQRGR